MSRRRFPDKRWAREEEPPVKKALNKRTVFADAEEEQPPAAKSQRQCEENPEKALKTTRVFNQMMLIRQSHFWKSIALRGPFGDVLITDKLHLHRPLYNLIRLIFYKIHVKCVDFLNIDLRKMMEQEEVPKARDLMRMMCEKVFSIDDDGCKYEFNIPRMTDPLERIFSRNFITIDLNRQPQFLGMLRKMCDVRRIETSLAWLLKARNCIVRHIFYIAFDLLVFVYKTTIISEGVTNVSGFRQYTINTNGLFRMKIHDSAFRVACYHLGAHFQSELLTRKLPFNLLTQIACEEKEHLLVHMLEFGLIQLLPDEVKEYLTEWMAYVRRRLRKRIQDPDLLRQKIHECFGNQRGSFVFLANDARFREFLISVVGKILNSRKFTVFDGEWAEYTLSAVQEATKSRSFVNSQFFDVAHLCNTNARSVLAEFFSDSPEDQALLEHTVFLLFRFVIRFTCYIIRQVFHFDGREHFKYDGQFDEQIDDFDDFDQYERNPIITIPAPTDTPTLPEEAREPSNRVADRGPDFFPVTLRMIPTDQPPPPLAAGYVRDDRKVTAVPAAPEPPERQWVPKPVKTEKRSFLPEELMTTPAPSKPPPLLSVVKQEDPLSPEVTDEELRRARALRTPSEASLSLRIDDEEGAIPKKWIDAYKLTLEWNEDLKRQLARVEARYEKMCK